MALADHTEQPDTYKEVGSADSLYNPDVGRVRAQARKIGFKSSVPAVPDETTGTFWIQLIYPKGQQPQALANLQALIVWVDKQPGLYAIKYRHFGRSRSKTSSAYAMNFGIGQRPAGLPVAYLQPEEDEQDA